MIDQKFIESMREEMAQQKGGRDSYAYRQGGVFIDGVLCNVIVEADHQADCLSVEVRLEFDQVTVHGFIQDPSDLRWNHLWVNYEAALQNCKRQLYEHEDASAFRAAAEQAALNAEIIPSKPNRENHSRL